MKVYDHANLPAADKLVKTLAPPESDTRPTPKPRFDFYTLLTESEEVIPDTPSLVVADAKVKQEEKSEPSVAETPAEAVTTTTAPPEKTTKPKQVYVLQAGAFRKAEDADSVRARLLLLNLTASIEKVTIKPGDIWHRVLVGPFNDTQTLTEKRRILQSNGIDSIQVKRTL
jgi:cell division protein FtsN